MSRERRGSGRPTTPLLSSEAIIAEGLRLLASGGEEAVTMRAIAAGLGVRPSSLYNHVSDRGEIISGIRDSLCTHINTACFATLPWQEALACWADSYRDAFKRYPGTLEYFATLPIAPDSGTSRMYEEVSAGLLAAGWPAARVLSVVVAFESFIMGSALDANASPTMLQPGPSGRDMALTTVFNARAEALAARGVSPADEAYFFGRDLLLESLAAEFERCGYASSRA